MIDMIYYLYKTTNRVNKKIYVGAHKTNNINDGYMGSGKILNLAVDTELQHRATILAQSDDAKIKRIESFERIGHQQGNKNSQYGTCWVVHEKNGCKKINRDELSSYENIGYIRGRKL